MKLVQLIMLVFLFVGALGGCSSGGGSSEVESWELRPFYGETRFLIVDEMGKPIPEATLTVEHLAIVELEDVDSIVGNEDGFITMHQLERGTVYWGDAPPPPTFTFSAPGYAAQPFSVDDLAVRTSYDPYRDENLPTTTFQNGDQTYELPLFEFTIRLVASD